MNSAFPAKQPPLCRRADALAGEQVAAPDQDPVDRFALAIGAFPMLETARIGGEV